MVCDRNGLMLPKNNAGLCVLPLFGTLMLINRKPDLKKKNIGQCRVYFLTIGTKWYEIDIILQEYNPEARHCCRGLVLLKCESTTGPHKGSLAH